MGRYSLPDKFFFILRKRVGNEEISEGKFFQLRDSEKTKLTTAICDPAGLKVAPGGTWQNPEVPPENCGIPTISV